MSLFGKILEKLGFHSGSAAQQAPTGQQAPSAQQSAQQSSSASSTTTQTAPPTAPTQSAPPQKISVVDVVTKLEGLAASHPEKLDWKNSIVDLLKLLGIDSSLASRKELATELGCPPAKMGDSTQMNIWLHEAVLQKIAENGGNIPKELLH